MRYFTFGRTWRWWTIRRWLLPGTGCWTSCARRECADARRIVDKVAFRAVPNLDRLAEHQRRFVERMKSPEAPSRVVLAGPPGYGKSTAIAALIQSTFQGHGDARVLVIGPRMLLAQWASMLRADDGFEVHVVAAPEYRRLQLRTPPGDNPWTGPGVYLTSPEFLSVGHRAAEIRAAAWDLVVFEELHLYQIGLRRELLDALWSAASTRTLVATVSRLDAGMITSGTAAVVVQLDSEAVARLQAIPAPSRVIHVQTYKVTAEELAFQHRLRGAS